MDIATQVKQVYWHLAYLRSKYELLLFQDSLFTGFLNAAELRANTGETNRLEMISARSQSLEVKNQVQQVVADLSINYQNFQTLLNSNIPVYPADTVLKRIAIRPLLDSIALKDNPSAGYMQQMVEISHLEKRVENSQLWPDFKIGYFSQTIQGVQDVNGIPQTFGLGDRFTGFQAGIEIPLWFIPYKSKSNAAKLKQKVAQTNAEYFDKSLAGSYKELQRNFSKYSNSVDYYENQAIPEADLIIKQATLSYKAGAMDYLDYIMNLNRALSIKDNYLDALNNYNQTIVSIEFITAKIY